ncbi:arsenite efflux MFS transporter ArsK [Chelatococcus asaccharovorans]|uniref:Putative MFS family arabinose efflux permease n=1 Tax=Chelatococcus asaccharovorans TaxID=28210 RepID=A0A2V3UHW1_9HYPH|nr:arsenite efflux MFS transporter ArsK [Chelatococcus asaccharovorans]MBS7705660.1 arsenite efflux MFS transporter ArsK [Chelatococcus asaccharovorans]PXW58678.1 putative MFS family arabinose efflux permease [Chelatococcus asaccharovorans]
MGRWIDVAALGVTQIIGYGTLYYSFSILAPAMARDFGWPSEWIFAALSAALLTGGLVAPWAGRWIDRFGAGRVMAVGSMAAALALAACALAPYGFLFVPALFAIEIAATLVQYGAAFPLLVQRHPGTAQRSIVYLTLIAGFASTIFWPLSTWLHDFLTWQQIYLVFALMHVVLCLPIHLWMSRRLPIAAEPADGDGARKPPSPHSSLPPEARSKGFLLMAAGFALQSFISSAILVHMVPMLGALGLGLASVAVGALFGPSQVASRFINMIFGRELSQASLAIVSAALLPIALVLLLVTAPSFTGAMLFAVLFGMGNGLYSIVGGTLPLALFGAEGYGARQGQMMSVRLIVGSAAPFAFALMMDQIGVKGALAVAALFGGCAVVAFAAIARLVAVVPVRQLGDGMLPR